MVPLDVRRFIVQDKSAERDSLPHNDRQVSRNYLLKYFPISLLQPLLATSFCSANWDSSIATR
jgi:hypothetical protein